MLSVVSYPNKTIDEIYRIHKESHVDISQLLVEYYDCLHHDFIQNDPQFEGDDELRYRYSLILLSDKYGVDLKAGNEARAFVSY